jgi:hypothetical protein
MSAPSLPESPGTSRLLLIYFRFDPDRDMTPWKRTVGLKSRSSLLVSDVLFIGFYFFKKCEIEKARIQVTEY